MYLLIFLFTFISYFMSNKSFCVFKILYFQIIKYLFLFLLIIDILQILLLIFFRNYDFFQYSNICFIFVSI